MESAALIDSFAEFARRKNVDKPTMIRILEDVFRAMIRKKYEVDDNFDVIINTENGDLQLFRFREIIENDSEDIWDLDKVSLDEARTISPDFEVGEELSEEISLDSFGRRAISMARQALVQKVKSLEKNFILNKYKGLVGEIVSGEVYQVLSREVFLSDSEGNDLILPRSEQIPKDRFRKGEQMRAIVQSVDVSGSTPKVILSRTSPLFLKRLFESEVPEVFEGVINIKKVVRDPGERAKLTVESYDDRIDPVGACVGIKGSRIHNIVRELCNENIDVINYTDNEELYISRSLNPAKISRIQINRESNRIAISLKPDQVSLALGKKGQNIRLASQLLGMEIDVIRESGNIDEEDVDLNEFTDEIEEWIIAELRKVGLDTAKSVLTLPKEDLIRRTDLEEGTINEIIKILRSEFE